MSINRVTLSTKPSSLDQRPRLRPVVAAATLALLGLSPAWAVNDYTSTKLLRTSFASPGARAAGMGGAFIGLADDSSAAFLNPAGIALLPQTEVTIEGRTRSTDFDYGLGPNAEIDNFDSTSLSYASLVVPMGDGNWGFGVFYGSLGDTQNEIAPGSFIGPEDPTQPGTLPFSGSLDLEDRYFGAGAGFKVSDSLRLGASVYQAKREMDAASVFDGFFFLPEPLPFIGSVNTATDQVSDTDIGFNLGAHWASNDDVYSVGFSYRSELEFDRPTTYRSVSGSFPTGSVPNGTELINVSGVGSSIIPSAYGLGFGWRPDKNWVVALDLAYISFSDILDEKRPADGVDTLGREFLLSRGSVYQIADYLDIDNAIEVRLGAEYSFEQGENTWWARGGIWREADSSLRFDHNGFIDGAPTDPVYSGLTPEELTFFADTYSLVFPRLGSVTHGTLGVGFARGGFFADFAFDYSERDTEFVFSAGFAFE